MLPISRFCSPVALTLLLTACGGASDQPREDVRTVAPAETKLAPTKLVAADDAQLNGEATSDEATVPLGASVEGRVANKTYALPYAIVLRGRANFADRPETVVFVMSDQPDLCSHLQQGTLPSKSNMLAVALLGAQKGYTPGLRFLPGGEQDDEEQPMASVYLRSLDDQCRIAPALGRRGATALYGHATLGGLDASGGTLGFQLQMVDDFERSIGQLSGQVSAAACDAPLLFAHAAEFFEGKVATEACR